MKIKQFNGNEAEFRRDEIGVLTNGDSISVATDAAGSQIIIQGEHTHLLSSPFKSHEAACEAAGSLLFMDDPEPTKMWVGVIVPSPWVNLKTAGVVDQLFAIFGSAMRGPSRH